MDLQLSLSTKSKIGCSYTGATEFMVRNFLLHKTFRTLRQNIFTARNYRVGKEQRFQTHCMSCASRIDNSFTASIDRCFFETYVRI